MASQRSFSYGLVVGAIFFASIFDQVSAMNIEYCSSLNTAQTGANSSIFQSNGLCYNFCLDDFAFAILQDATCWCSNDAPGTTTSVDDCNLHCPGYPNDLCGSSNGLFGYLALTKSPTATVDGGGAASSTSATVHSTSDTTSNTPATTSSSSSMHTTSSSSSTSTWTPTPVTSLETVTGQVRTVTVTPTVPPSSQSLTGAARKSGSSGLSTGGAVGLTVGLVALVALVCSIIYFCIRRRQKEKAEEYNNFSRRGSTSGLGGPIPSRTMSENSRYVLGTDGRQVVETWEPESRDAPGSRRSRLMPVDPRLDPFAPVYQWGENKSRESVNTIRDDHDYSRRVHQQGPILRATNPDE